MERLTAVETVGSGAEMENGPRENRSYETEVMTPVPSKQADKENRVSSSLKLFEAPEYSGDNEDYGSERDISDHHPLPRPLAWRVTL